MAIVKHWLAECKGCGAFFEWCSDEKPPKSVCWCKDCFIYTGKDRYMKVKRIKGEPDDYNGMILKPCVGVGKYHTPLNQGGV